MTKLTKMNLIKILLMILGIGLIAYTVFLFFYFVKLENSQNESFQYWYENEYKPDSFRAPVVRIIAQAESQLVTILREEGIRETLTLSRGPEKNHQTIRKGDTLIKIRNSEIVILKHVNGKEEEIELPFYHQ